MYGMTGYGTNVYAGLRQESAKATIAYVGTRTITALTNFTRSVVALTNFTRSVVALTNFVRTIRI
jgi:hypothetical protein